MKLFLQHRRRTKRQVNFTSHVIKFPFLRMVGNSHHPELKCEFFWGVICYFINCLNVFKKIACVSFAHLLTSLTVNKFCALSGIAVACSTLGGYTMFDNITKKYRKTLALSQPTIKEVI